MKLIVGLGNVGDHFESTPHNIGFMLVDYFLNKFRSCLLCVKKEFTSLNYHLQIEDFKFILAKPQTYVNLSGIAVKKIMTHYNVLSNDLLVLNDDVYLQAGSFKLKDKGGHGGHNGLRNIIDILEINNFKRLRIGVGLNYGLPLEKYVLSRFSHEVQELILSQFILFQDLLIYFIKGFSVTEILNLINHQKKCF